MGGKKGRRGGEFKTRVFQPHQDTQGSDVRVGAALGGGVTLAALALVLALLIDNRGRNK